MVNERAVDPAIVEKLAKKIVDPSVSLPERYRALFALRNAEGQRASEALIAALQTDSALFRHEVCFCLGQRQDQYAIETLQRVLKDESEHPMVRHEAGEALGAIGSGPCLESVATHAKDGCQEVRETCQLALERIEHYRKQKEEEEKNENPYFSVDPTPALPASTPFEELRALLLDETAPMFRRYQALFALRNKGGRDAVEALGASFTCTSALLKHEVAYVLGQMQDPRSVDILEKVLRDPSEHAMVRHEAAEALGAVGEPHCLDLLREYSQDTEKIVAHSCMVALDMIENGEDIALEAA